jgi:U1 small nuclear ribonucleoprotein 70kDa
VSRNWHAVFERLNDLLSIRGGFQGGPGGPGGPGPGMGNGFPQGGFGGPPPGFGGPPAGGFGGGGGGMKREFEGGYDSDAKRRRY